MVDVNSVAFKEDVEYIKSRVASIADFPKPGILFRDVTSLCEDAQAFALCIDRLYDLFCSLHIDKVVCAEARGFVFGAPLAMRLKAGLVLVRKPGKLPRKTIEASYELEYGSNTLQMNEGSIKAGERVLVFDDLLATGGTVGAMIKLVKSQQGVVVQAGFVLELFDLGGAEAITDNYAVPCISLIKFPGH